MAYKKECVLEEKECTNCGECDRCDLDPKKKCNNCCKCIDTDSDFKGVYIDEIIDDNEDEIEDIGETAQLTKWKFDKDVIEEYKK